MRPVPVRARLLALAALLVVLPALTGPAGAATQADDAADALATTIAALPTRTPFAAPTAPLADETPPPAETPAPVAVEPTVPKPGYAKGIVTNARGEPIPDAAITVLVVGTTMAGDDTSFQPSVGADGRYALRLPDGIYRVEATVALTLAGGRYLAALRPTDGGQADYQDASQGVVEAFVWQVAGRRPGRDGGDGTYPGDYYGGSLWVQDANLFESSDSDLLLANRYPEDARIVLSLSPRGPLVDGSPGREFVAELDLSGKSLANRASQIGYVVDVPLGSYVATAAVVDPEGGETPLLLSTSYAGDGTSAPTLEIDFRPAGDYWFDPSDLT